MNTCVTDSLCCTPETAAAAAAKSLQSCPTLCDPIDGSPPGSTLPGILQARTLEWVAISFSNVHPWDSPGKNTSGLPFPSPMHIPGILQARTLEWGAIAFSNAHPWDSPGKNTGVGCHCLLQHLKLAYCKSTISQLHSKKKKNPAPNSPVRLHC